MADEYDDVEDSGSIFWPILIMIIGVFIACYGVYDGVNQHNLQKRTEKTNALVVQKTLHDKIDSPYHSLTYYFVIGDKKYKSSYNIDYKLWSSFPIKSTKSTDFTDYHKTEGLVDIAYESGNPTNNHVLGQEKPMWLSVFKTGFGFVMFGIGIWWLISSNSSGNNSGGGSNNINIRNNGSTIQYDHKRS